MARLHLILGPVGAGKTTFARKLAQERRAVFLNLDDWMARLYGEDERPAEGRIEWYVERTERCLGLIWDLAARLVDLETEVVLEVGLVRRVDRRAFYARVDGAGVEMAVYLLDAPRDVRRARVQRRNEEKGETFAVHVPMAFFELASDLWEAPDEVERRARGVVVS